MKVKCILVHFYLAFYLALSPQLNGIMMLENYWPSNFPSRNWPEELKICTVNKTNFKILS